MSNLTSHESAQTGKILSFPMIQTPSRQERPAVSTPQTDEIIAEAKELDEKSNYKSDFDYEVYRKIELRYADKPIRGGITLKRAFRLVNSHSTCQQCLYAFEVDTYGRGCVHNCAYCYAKAQLTVHGWWNRPIPVPANLNELRSAFYTTFETDKKHKWRDILSRRIPLRIGSMSDSFMWLDQKIKITQELLQILSFYKYPYVIFTRSDLVATDEYLSLLDAKLGSVQFSLSSMNDTLNRLIEPGAPSAKRRLVAAGKLTNAGIWTTVRINPLFPIYPDGYFTDPQFSWKGDVPKFDYSSFDMVNEIADSGVHSILAGFGRFSHLSMTAIERATDFDLKQFYRRDLVNKSERDFHFSDREIRYYYEQLKKRCISRGVEFSTCYIGNGEGHFWKDQDLWSNKKDCCNVKGHVSSFNKDAREIPFDLRMKHTVQKNLKPTSDDLHKPLGVDSVSSTRKSPEQTL